MRSIIASSVAILTAFAFSAPAQTQSNYPPRSPTVETLPPPKEPSRPAPGYKNVYRLLATDSHEHLFTSDANEANRLIRDGAFRSEGVGFSVLDKEYKDSVPLYRFVRPDGYHFLSTDTNAGAQQGVRREGILGYIDPQPRAGTVALNAWMNSDTGAIMYTTDPTGENAPRSGLVYRGVVGYVSK
jgi:hypothetical protein